MNESCYANGAHRAAATTSNHNKMAKERAGFVTMGPSHKLGRSGDQLFAAFADFLTVSQHHLLKAQDVGAVLGAKPADGEADHA
jgi:hypothetical protein